MCPRVDDTERSRDGRHGARAFDTRNSSWRVSLRYFRRIRRHPSSADDCPPAPDPDPPPPSRRLDAFDVQARGAWMGRCGSRRRWTRVDAPAGSVRHGRRRPAKAEAPHLAGKLRVLPWREEVDEAAGTASLDSAPSVSSATRPQPLAVLRSSICTECFLQVKAPSRVAPGEDPTAKCPFCKTPGYTVAFKGKKTESERQTERQEELEKEAAKARLARSARRGETAPTAAPPPPPPPRPSRESERPPVRPPRRRARATRLARPRGLGGGVRGDDAAAAHPGRSVARSRSRSRRGARGSARGPRPRALAAPRRRIAVETRAQALRAEALERERARGRFPGPRPSGAEGEPARTRTTRITRLRANAR